MNIDITPETARVVREELQSGHFRSLDDLILSGVRAWHEKNQTATTEPGASGKTLVDFFRESPLVGLELEFSRSRDTGQDIAL